MKYQITEQAIQSPILVALPTYPHENVGIGGKYYVKEGSNCATCAKEVVKDLKGESGAKERRFFREALDHEYVAICEQYKSTGGIPGYLIIIPDEAKPVTAALPK